MAFFIGGPFASGTWEMLNSMTYVDGLFFRQLLCDGDNFNECCMSPICTSVLLASPNRPTHLTSLELLCTRQSWYPQRLASVLIDVFMPFLQLPIKYMWKDSPVLHVLRWGIRHIIHMSSSNAVSQHRRQPRHTYMRTKLVKL
jgi:hypothetical protein